MRTLVVIPCFNEVNTIAAILNEIRLLSCNYEPLVIDDGSTDATFDKAARRGPCIRLLHNLGIGGAVQTGIKYAHRQGYDFCVQLDGDGQHPPAQVEVLLEAYARQEADIIVGNRYSADNKYRSSWDRRLGSRIISGVLAFAFGGTRVNDPTSGFRLMNRKAIAFFAARYPHDFPEPISIACALRHGLTVGEVGVQMRARKHGLSSIGGLRAFSYMIRVVFYVLLARFEQAEESEQTNDEYQD
jgi:glycosyltransferase involved in cell wall biosynthesis